MAASFRTTARLDAHSWKRAGQQPEREEILKRIEDLVSNGELVPAVRLYRDEISEEADTKEAWGCHSLIGLDLQHHLFDQQPLLWIGVGQHFLQSHYMFPVRCLPMIGRVIRVLQWFQSLFEILRK